MDVGLKLVMATLVSAQLLAAAWLPRPSLLSRRDNAMLATPDGWLMSAPDDSAPEFDDFERECFGDDDGCDAWFYGEECVLYP